MSESPYRRQLSGLGAAVMAVFVSAILIGCSLPLFGVMTFFSPLILLMACGITLTGLLKYPFRRRLHLEHPAAVFLGAWAVAVPLAAVAAPLSDLLARHTPAHLRWGFDPKDPELTAFQTCVAFLQLLVTLVAAGRMYLRTPAEARFVGELPRKGVSLFLVVLGSMFFFVALAVSAPLTSALLVDLFARRAKPALQPWIFGYAVLSALPAVLVGLACLRRALWLRDIQVRIDEHPRSTIRAAATGLVELHGKAQPLDPAQAGEPILLLRDATAPEPRRRIGDFLLDDGTGRVRVCLPDGAAPGRDGVIDLVRRSQAAGLQPEYLLQPGDEVYVLGEFQPSADLPRIAAWTPPAGRFLAPLAQELFQQNWAMGPGLDFAELLDLKLSPVVFSVTDAGEEKLRRLVRLRWIRSLVLGFLLIAGAGAYLLRVAPR